MQVRKVLRRRVRRSGTEGNVTGDIQVVVAANTGRTGEGGKVTRASSRQRLHVEQGPDRTDTGRA